MPKPILPERLRAAKLPADLITVPQAAARVGVHPESLYRAIRAGEFSPAVKIGHQIRISVPRLEGYLHGETSAQ